MSHKCMCAHRNSVYLKIIKKKICKNKITFKRTRQFEAKRRDVEKLLHALNDLFRFVTLIWQFMLLFATHFDITEPKTAKSCGRDKR